MVDIVKKSIIIIISSMENINPPKHRRERPCKNKNTTQICPNTSIIYILLKNKFHDSR